MPEPPSLSRKACDVDVVVSERNLARGHDLACNWPNSKAGKLKLSSHDPATWTLERFVSTLVDDDVDAKNGGAANSSARPTARPIFILQVWCRNPYPSLSRLNFLFTLHNPRLYPRAHDHRVRPKRITNAICRPPRLCLPAESSVSSPERGERDSGSGDKD